jgi:transcriptional regulator with XRE-family HTH domain
MMHGIELQSRREALSLSQDDLARLLNVNRLTALVRPFAAACRVPAAKAPCRAAGNVHSECAHGSHRKGL